jgi:hypothetical protein
MGARRGAHVSVAYRRVTQFSCLFLLGIALFPTAPEVLAVLISKLHSVPPKFDRISNVPVGKVRSRGNVRDGPSTNRANNHIHITEHKN